MSSPTTPAPAATAARAFDKRPSWVPLLTALLVPPALVFGLFTVSAWVNPAAWRDADAPPVSSAAFADETITAQVAIRLVDGRGQPVVGRRVTVSHEPSPTRKGETVDLQTDSAGFATVAFPKVGNVVARVDGTDTQSSVSLQASRRETYTLTLVLAP